MRKRMLWRPENRKEMKRRLKPVVLMTALVLVLLLISCSSQPEKKAVIGIAWRSNQNAETFQAVCQAIESAGGVPVVLDQILSADLNYENGMLTEGKDADGCLSDEAAKLVRCNSWQDSNAETAMDGITAVVFPGGEEISPSLYYDPKPALSTEVFSAERDVSDYLTMTYCLDHDIPVMGFCRGMQMLSVVSGAEVIQDVPAYFSELGVPYGYEHRNQKATPDSYRDYAPHDVQIVSDSFLYEMVSSNVLTGCPSWHHQAIRNVDNTRLVITGITETNGVQIIEAVERTDKTFAVGLQFHPEAALVKHLENADNRNDFMDYKTALSIFQWIVEERYLEQDAADAA